jgi:hypothetical protein
MAMSDANTFAVSLSSCDPHDADASKGYTAANQHTYAVMSKGEGIHCDTATTTASIDGVSFTRFRLTTRKNNLIQSNEVTMYACYKGYNISIYLLIYSKHAKEELESMLEHSRFSR